MLLSVKQVTFSLCIISDHLPFLDFSCKSSLGINLTVYRPLSL